MDRLRIKNWGKYQHYKDRNPPWVKLYTSIIQKYHQDGTPNPVRSLSCPAWRLYLSLFCLAPRFDGMIPNDPSFITAETGADASHLGDLLQAGLIEACTDTASADASNHASKVATEALDSENRVQSTDTDGVPSTPEPEVPAPARNGISFDYAAGKLLGVTDADRGEWAAAFPAVSVEVELLRAEQWMKDNPAKRKKHVRRFLTNWLGRCQERGGTSPTLFDRKPARTDTGEPNI